MGCIFADWQAQKQANFIRGDFMPKVYIIEDDDNIRELVMYALDTSNFKSVGFENSAIFWKALKNEVPDLVLLDIMLPNEDGITILKKLKSDNKTKELPVIMLTAKGSEYDRVKGLDLGADDYITKPFSVLELISRIKAVLRRSTSIENNNIITIGNVTIYLDKRNVVSEGESIVLTFKEFELLHYLMQNRDIVLDREKILERVWGFDFEGESRTVDVHIKTLRQKLKNGGEIIKTIRNVGYKAGE